MHAHSLLVRVCMCTQGKTDKCDADRNEAKQSAKSVLCTFIKHYKHSATPPFFDLALDSVRDACCMLEKWRLINKSDIQWLTMHTREPTGRGMHAYRQLSLCTTELITACHTVSAFRLMGICCGHMGSWDL